MNNKELFDLMCTYEESHKNLENKMSFIEDELLKELLNLLNKEGYDLLGSYDEGTFTFLDSGECDVSSIDSFHTLKISYIKGYFKITYIDSDLYADFNKIENIIENWCKSIVDPVFESQSKIL